MRPVQARRGWVYLADLDPRRGTEPGKVRPVLVLQSDLLNAAHPSTIVLPLTTQLHPEAAHLRVRLKNGEAGLDRDNDVLIDQPRAIDNRRLLRPLGPAPAGSLRRVEENFLLILDIERDSGAPASPGGEEVHDRRRRYKAGRARAGR